MASRPLSYTDGSAFKPALGLIISGNDDYVISQHEAPSIYAFVRDIALGQGLKHSDFQGAAFIPGESPHLEIYLNPNVAFKDAISAVRDLSSIPDLHCFGEVICCRPQLVDDSA